MGGFDHRSGSGFVAAKKGDYHDAIDKRKARVHLLVHETTGALSQYSAKRLRFLGRQAERTGCDGTDYRNTGTYSFVMHYAQRISAACVMYGAKNTLKTIRIAVRKRARRAASGGAE